MSLSVGGYGLGNGIPNCSCGSPVFDQAGRCLSLSTCPACMAIRLDVIRGAEYACALVKGGDTDKVVLLKQKEFFGL